MTDFQPIISVPVFRRLWVVVLLTCLIFTFPIALVILVSGDVYRWKNHAFRPIGKSARFIYAGILAVWLAAAIGKFVLSPETTKQAWQENAVVSAPAHEAANGSSSDNAPTPPIQTDGPRIRIESENTQYGQVVVLTADDEPFTIERIVFNDRAEEKNCDLPKYGLSPESTDTSNMGASMQSVNGTQLPVTLKRGDQAKFFSGCGQTMSLTVYTDKGVTHLKTDDAE